MKLLNYIKGLRKGKEAHHLEKEAMKDPFLADTLDGYNSVEGNQEKQIKALRDKIVAKTARKQNRAAVWSVAASLLLILSLGSYWLFKEDPPLENRYIALDRIPEPVSMLKTPDSTKKQKDSIEKETLLATEKQKQEIKISSSSLNAIQRVVLNETAKSTKVTDIQQLTPSTATVLPAMDSNNISLMEEWPVALNEVRGKVTNLQGEPIVGASIILKGTNKGTVSGIDGSFALNTGSHNKLSVHFIGYKPMDLSVDTYNNLLIAMHEDNQVFSENTIVGYGTQKKQDLTGSVSVVKLAGTPQPVVGKRAYRKYLKKNLAHPTDSACTRKKGKVQLSFSIDKHGRPENILVKKSFCPSASQEAIRLIEEGPNWTVREDTVSITIQF